MQEIEIEFSPQATIRDPGSFSANILEPGDPCKFTTEQVIILTLALSIKHQALGIEDNPLTNLSIIFAGKSQLILVSIFSILLA